jgi:hypothetical protein
MGLALLGWISYRANQKAPAVPPSATEYAVIALVSSALTIAGGAIYGRIGRADARHARSAVRRLVGVGRTVRSARTRLEVMQDARDMRPAALAATAELMTVETAIGDAILDWRDVHSEALRDISGGEDAG